MTLLPTLGHGVNAFSGLLLLALGLYVLSVRPRRRANLALAGFTMLFGAGFVLRNLVGDADPAFPPLFALQRFALFPLAGAFLVALALLWPSPLRATERRAAAAAALVAAVHGAAALALEAGRATPEALIGESPVAFFLGGRVLAASFWFALLLLPLRYPAREAPAQAQLALVSCGLLLWMATRAGMEAIAGSPSTATPADFGPLALVAGLWLWNAGRAEGCGARIARNVAWVALLLPLLGMLGAVAGRWTGTDLPFGTNGVLRIGTAGVLAYAILRHQLLGLDVKVRWTVQQSTVAAAFVGVFFVASESASSFLATEGGLGTYLGIAAAGLLVFAMAPLQRAAERLAGAAMPGVKAPAEMSPAERLAVYRDAAAQAWADGALDRSERLLLDRLQASLGLSRDEAMRAEQEAAREPA